METGLTFLLDVAKAHILALETDAADGQRVALWGGAFTWKDVSVHIRPSLQYLTHFASGRRESP